MIYRLSSDFKIPTPKGNPIRGNSAAIQAADILDLLNLPADLTNNLITIGSQSIITILVEQTVSGGTCIIIPIAYDQNGPNPSSIIGILPPRSFTQPYAFRYGASSGNFTLPMQSQDITGASKIGIHITSITGSSNGLKVQAWLR